MSYEYRTEPVNTKSAVEFLKLCEPSRKPTYTTYALKHIIEAVDGKYVNNEAVIESAVTLGLRISYQNGGNPLLFLRPVTVEKAIETRCNVNNVELKNAYDWYKGYLLRIRKLNGEVKMKYLTDHA